MIVNCFQISDEPQLIPCDYESAVNAAEKADACIWIDIQGFEAGDLEEKLDKLEVKGLARRLCLEACDRPGFYPMNKLTFLVIPVLADTEDFSEVRHVAFLARPNFLLTLRDTRATRLQRTITPQESADWLPDGSIAGLVSALMIVLSLESLKRMSELRDMIMMLEERMEREPTSVEVKEISHKRSELLTLESVVSGQLPVIQAFIANEKASSKGENIQEFLICALANLQATDRSLDWLEGRIDVMRSLVDMRAQDKMNRRLGRLTVLSMIFMPMTFLAGVWGMNFNSMPELNYPFGYPIAIGSMFLIGTGMFSYFRRRGWFN
jgi:magnesium transporter